MKKDQVLPIKPDEFSWCQHQENSSPGDKKDQDLTRNTDAALEEKIYRALWNDDVLRVTDYSNFDIHVKNNTLHMRGHVTNTSNYQRIEKALQPFECERGNWSNLVIDENLKYQVAETLGEIEKVNHCKFFTGVSHGVVLLNGEVSSLHIRQKAEESVAAHPGVRGVINYIRIPGVDLHAQDNRLLQPPIGKQIFFSDGISGIVRQVVINPLNRRVIAMTIQGFMLGLNKNLALLNDSGGHSAEQLLVIPMSAVRYVTQSSGFLAISSTDSAKYQIFDGSQFTAPNMGWVPPYPYCPVEVLIPVVIQQAHSIPQAETNRVLQTTNTVIVKI